MSFLSKSIYNKISTNYRLINHCTIWNSLFVSSQRNAAFTFENDTNYYNINDDNNMFQNSRRDNRMRFDRQNFGSKKFKKQQIQWPNENLTPFEKNFYEEHPELKNMTHNEVREIREKGGMLTFGKNIPKPFRTFEESGISEHWLKHLAKLKITHPTPIQQQGIPMALSGRDVIGISRTGSGKTLTYLLPCVVHISAQPTVKPGDGPIALVLAPTRELANQIATEIDKLIQSNRALSLKYCAVYGGADRHKQISSLRRSPDILVATPGRLMDLLECGETNFKRTTYCVLDEADRMLDMGFRDDIETILSYIRPDKQMLMWSATWPQEIQSIALRYMNDPIRVQIGSTDLVANSNIKQCFRLINNHDPQVKLEILAKDCNELVSENKKILIFTNQKRTANNLAFGLQRKVTKLQRYQIDAIHGDKPQATRENILHSFRSKTDLRILIATDVVARGIDIDDIDCIIVYDFPSDIETYVHRIGRTARGHKQGLSLAYLNMDDVDRLGNKLIQVLQKAKQPVPKWLQSKIL